MNAAEFQAASCAILGTTIGWQSKIARQMNKPVRTIQRWIAADYVPDWAEAKILAMMGGTERSPFPRDEWMIGDALGQDGSRREYIMHMQPPRFVARIVAVDDDGEPEPSEHPADVLSGMVYASDGYVICEMEWIDRPKAGEVTQLMEAAANEIDRISEIDT